MNLQLFEVFQSLSWNAGTGVALVSQFSERDEENQRGFTWANHNENQLRLMLGRAALNSLG